MRRTWRSPRHAARETHRGDDLAWRERGFEHAAEELVGRDLARAGDDGRAERRAPPPDSRRPGRCWRPSRRWCRDCAPPDRRYRPASSASAGRALRHDSGFRDVGVARHRADGDVLPAVFDTPVSARDRRKIDQRRRRGEPLLHRRKQRHAAGHAADFRAPRASNAPLRERSRACDRRKFSAFCLFPLTLFGGLERATRFE